MTGFRLYLRAVVWNRLTLIGFLLCVSCYGYVLWGIALHQWGVIQQHIWLYNICYAVGSIGIIVAAMTFFGIDTYLVARRVLLCLSNGRMPRGHARSYCSRRGLALARAVAREHNLPGWSLL